MVKDSLRRYTKDKSLINDLSQDVEIKLLKYQKINKKLVGLVCRSVYIDYYRGLKKLDLNFENKINSAEEDIIKKETKEIVFKAIDSLPSNQKEIIILRYYFGLRYKKICQIMGVCKNTATSYMNYAKINIRKILNHQLNQLL